ncbi:TRAP transporter small permease subunit [Vibrio sp. S9_S30]|uniref:TRAP transporter small permease n=1 Tax=Vibrio sp. S9_S30 TaxID=2720226 RepID=UPI00168115F5|nr:TRAP transporter small permease subunit [Vibrio sp. S9_S30]MBD1556945.1 TRAP transporter small permease subunit [Vibrio sp. S9_S30]
MLKLLFKVNNKILDFERNLTCLYLFLIVSLIFTSAVLRTAGYPQAWMNDLGKLLFGWVIFLGADIALSKGKHIGVEYFEEKLPERVRRVVGAVWSLLIVAFLLFIVYYGWYLVERSRRNFDSLVISDMLFAFISILLFSILIAAEEKFNQKKSNAKAIAIFILCFTTLSGGVYLLDLNSNPKPLSYIFLIAAVPVGGALMVRSQILLLFKKEAN